MRLLILSLIPALMMAKTLSAPLSAVNGDQATATLQQAQEGLSGVVIRHFDAAHTAIIANALVTAYNPSNQTARLALSPYDGLHQNSLPYGEWTPREGDEVRIAPDYSRALLLAPERVVYDRVTSAFKTLSWVHPDRFAAYLSQNGHPSPTPEDFNGFCTDNAVGLLYVYFDSSLFTLDCKSLSLLQVVNAPTVYDTVQLPFFTRIENIREGFWGEGTDAMKRYAPYYRSLIETANAGSPLLAQYRQSGDKASFERDVKEPDAAEDESWFGGLFNIFGDVEIGREMDNEE